MMRTLNLGSNIWFVLYYENGEITGMEEHDWREGGSISKNPNLTWEEFFVETVVGRAAGEDYKKLVQKEALLFLQSNEKKRTII